MCHLFKELFSQKSLHSFSVSTTGFKLPIGAQNPLFSFSDANLWLKCAVLLRSRKNFKKRRLFQKKIAEIAFALAPYTFRMKNTGINFDYLRILYKFVVLKAMKRRQRDAAVPLSCYILTSGVPTSLVCGNVQPPRGLSAPAAPTSGNVQSPNTVRQHPKGVIFNPLPK